MNWHTILLMVAVGFAAPACRPARQTEAPAEDVQYEVAALADEAVQMAKREGLALDYSVESVERVEGILAKLYIRASLSEDERIDTGMRYGAYVGEVVRLKWGGRWARNHPQVGANSYPLNTRGNDVFPLGWCVKRLVNGPEDNVWNKFQRVFLDRGPGELREHR